MLNTHIHAARITIIYSKTKSTSPVDWCPRDPTKINNLERKKNEQANSLLPSMTPKQGEEKKGKRREKKEEKKGQPSNHPSLCDRSKHRSVLPQEHWIGDDWHHRRPTCFTTEHPLASVIVGTGVLGLLGGEVENRYVRSGPDSYSIIGEANIQTPVCKQMSHPDFLPKLDTKTVYLTCYM